MLKGDERMRLLEDVYRAKNNMIDEFVNFKEKRVINENTDEFV